MVATPPLFARRTRRWSAAVTTASLLAIAPSVIAAPGDLVSYPVPPGTPNGVAVAPDGGVWFTLRSASIVGRLDPADGSITETALPEASEPTAITVGADGSVWFTLQAGNAIGRLVPAGDLVVYALPNDGSGPAGIAAATDGSVWFTERFGHRVGQVTADGDVHEWSTPGAHGPAGIAIGDDGLVWYAGQAASRLGTFDPATETFSSYALPATSAPTDVAIDGDGDAWVTLRRLNAVARFDPSTLGITTVGLAAGTSPTGIEAATDGGVWVAETAVGRLARIDIGTQAVTEVDLGGLTGPQSLASDGGALLWVAEAAAGRVSSFDVRPPDAIDPTIDLRSPTLGSWTAPGAPLVADYECHDEGGSGLVSCTGPVADGDVIVPSGLGAHTFEVAASDGAGNDATASGSFLAFTSVDGSALGGSARAGAGLTLSLGMNLGAKDDPGLVATSTAVDCTTGAALTGAEPAAVRTRVAHEGTLEIRWDTSRTWSGTCHRLAVQFSAEGWSGASATFGMISFPGGPSGKG